MGTSVGPPPSGVTSSVCASGWQADPCESPGPATSGEKRAVATADAPGSSATSRPRMLLLPVTCVGSGDPLAPSRVAFGTPWRAQRLCEVFLSVRTYEIWPAPALPGTTTKVPATSVP